MTTPSERLGMAARNVMEQATREARKTQSKYIDTTHVLTAILKKSCEARNILIKLNVDPADMLHTIKYSVSPSETGRAGTGQTVDLNRVLAMAREFADEDQAATIGTAHLLRGIINGANRASGLLHSAGICEDDIEDILNGTWVQASPAEEHCGPPVKTPEPAEPTTDDTLSHKAFLQKYVLAATVAARNTSITALVSLADSAWHEIEHLVNKDTDSHPDNGTQQS